MRLMLAENRISGCGYLGVTVLFVTLVEFDVVGFVDSSSPFLITAVGFQILHIPNQDAFYRVCVYFQVMFSQD